MFTNYSGILFTYNIECVYRESQVLLTDSSMEATMKFWTWKAKPRTGLWVYHMTWCPQFSLIFTHGSTNMVTKKKTSNYVYFTKLDRFSFSYIPPPLSLSSVQGRFIFNGMALNLNWSLQNHSLSKRCWITEAELIRRKSLRAIWRGSLEMGFQYLKVKNGQRWRNRPLKPSMPRAWKWSLIGFEKHV